MKLLPWLVGMIFHALNLTAPFSHHGKQARPLRPSFILPPLIMATPPATLILDAPIVYEEEQEVVGSDNAESITKKWKPTNHSNKFVGDILFRNALIQSLNIPSVKIIEKLGVSLAAEYARRLGIFSSLNMDYTLTLGTSSVTLYEMTKAFAQLGRLGKRAHPILINKVEDIEREKKYSGVKFITTNDLSHK